MELKKVGYCYASINQLKLKLDNYFNEYQDNYFYIFNVKTNLGLNYQLVVKRDKINFNFDRDCIESVCFSLSKGFYGAEKLRIGLRLSKKFTDDGIEVFNLMEMVNMVGVYVGHQIIKYFPHDYNVNTFRSRQSDFCYSMNLKRSNCVIFGLADKDDPKYKEHDRGTDFRRVCLSPLLGDMEDLHYV